MTAQDLFPFGKPKLLGTKIGDVDPGYRAWCQKQDWWLPKWKAIDDIWAGNSAAAAAPMELENLEAEQRIFGQSPAAFIEWWKKSYGERLRKDGAMLYIAHLRIALESWIACERRLTGKVERPPVPTPPKPIIPPKPVALKIEDMNLDEDVPF